MTYKVTKFFQTRFRCEAGWTGQRCESRLEVPNIIDIGMMDPGTETEPVHGYQPPGASGWLEHFQGYQTSGD